jgi:hypothetical protein
MLQMSLVNRMPPRIFCDVHAEELRSALETSPFNKAHRRSLGSRAFSSGKLIRRN